MRQFALLLFPVFWLAACAGDPEPAIEPLPTAPIEAFEAVGEPQRPVRPPTAAPTSLSTDIERLQDAKRAYEAAQDHAAAETRLRQERCRQAEGTQVAIEDGSADPAVFCTPPKD